MPLYEYKCASCGDVFEVIQKFSDEPLHEHPGCGGAVEKLISAAALQFKGSGWYVNDYGKSNSDSREKSKSESNAKGSDGKSSDSKSSDGKSSDSKSSDTKSSDSKSSDTKSSDSKNGGSKTVTTPAAGASTSSKTDKS